MIEGYRIGQASNMAQHHCFSLGITKGPAFIEAMTKYTWLYIELLGRLQERYGGANGPIPYGAKKGDEGFSPIIVKDEDAEIINTTK